MLPYIGEFLGMLLLILIGESVVANTTLEKSGMKGAGPLQITIAWGLAVMIPAFIFGNASGAHFNPALTLALAIEGSFPWYRVPGYIVAQFSGAFIGACLVYVMFKPHFEATKEPAAKLGVFCTSPSIPDFKQNMLSEIIATFVLVFSLKGIEQVEGLMPGMNSIFVFGIIASIGMSFGGLTGYAINPARDIGPRLAHALLPIKGKGASNWSYARVTLLGPLIGAVLAVILYGSIPWA